jgi:hypothetical protein
VREQLWHGGDNERRYQQVGGSGDESIRYEFNAQAYRADDFGRTADVKILSIGASDAFGLGVRRADSYVQVFCDLVASARQSAVANWNLSWCGKSNDYIARVLLSAVPALRPDIVLVSFTACGRRELFDLDGRCVDYFPCRTRDRSADPVADALRRGMDQIASPLDDLMNFTRNFKLVQLALSQYQMPWLYSILVPKQVEAVEAWLPSENRVPGAIEVVDYARDGTHPGPVSHHRFAALVFQTFRRCGSSSSDQLSDSPDPAPRVGLGRRDVAVG